MIQFFVKIEDTRTQPNRFLALTTKEFNKDISRFHKKTTTTRRRRARTTLKNDFKTPAFPL